MLVTELAELVRAHSGLGALRTYWYDGAVGGVPTAHHEQVGELSYVKVRLGRLIRGEQKGVDALIYRDLMTLARERAIASAYLLSGDEDLREGVVAAQDMGGQVVLLGIPTRQRANQSAALIRESDDHVVLPKEHWDKYFSRKDPADKATAPTEPAATLSDAKTAGRSFAATWIASAEPQDVHDLLGDRPRIPRELDVQLLGEAEKTLGSLTGKQDLRRELRGAFWGTVQDAHVAASGATGSS